MIDISIYFRPVLAEDSINEESVNHFILKNDEKGFPELKKRSIALFNVPEFRNQELNENNFQQANFRKQFNSLYPGRDWNLTIYDLGEIIPGETVKDTYFAVKQVVSELIKIDIVPLIIGGSQDLIVPIYQGFEKLEQYINILSVDSKLDLGDPDININSNGYVSHLLALQPCYLFNYSVVGYQTPFVSNEELELFDKLFFDRIRLGEYTNDSKIVEPLLRNSDVVNFDFNALKNSDWNNENRNPNGFYSEDFCQIAKYAGLSDKLSVLALLNIPNQKLSESQNSLIAQIIWYFIDGFQNRVGDFPIGSKKEYTKFIVFLEEINHEIIFYKSNKSDRWWMEVPYPSDKHTRYDRHHLVPCERKDYDLALMNEIPELWWKTFQKLG